PLQVELFQLADTDLDLAQDLPRMHALTWCRPAPVSPESAGDRCLHRHGGGWVCYHAAVDWHLLPPRCLLGGGGVQATCLGRSLREFQAAVVGLFTCPQWTRRLLFAFRSVNLQMDLVGPPEQASQHPKREGPLEQSKAGAQLHSLACLLPDLPVDTTFP